MEMTEKLEMKEEELMTKPIKFEVVVRGVFFDPTLTVSEAEDEVGNDVGELDTMHHDERYSIDFEGSAYTMRWERDGKLIERTGYKDVITDDVCPDLWPECESFTEKPLGCEDCGMRTEDVFRVGIVWVCDGCLHGWM